MKCIDKLQKIGIDKIATRTRITQDKVQDIIEMRFEKFDRTRALGFTQIIERDFGVEMDEWFSAFCEFHSDKSAENTESAPSDEVSEYIIIPMESDKKDKSYIALIVLLIVLVVAFVVFFAYNNFIAPSNENIANQSAPTPFQEIQNQRDLAKDDLSQSGEIVGDSTNQSADSSANQSIDSTNRDADSSDNKANLGDSSNDSSKNIATTDSINRDSIATSVIPTQPDELVITPNEPLWVGIIDLESRKKQQFSIAEKRTFPLDGDKIIITGHSSFSIAAPNLIKQLLGGNRAYFIYKADSGAREITRREFVELNGGAEW